MKKFTKVLEDINNGRFFKVNAEVELIIPADNEGEAGYLSDSILSSIEYGSNYQINNIGATDERVDESEVYQDKDKTPEEIIQLAWEKEFGDTLSHDGTERMEFYHKMRREGYDGKLIFKALKDKF